MKKKILCIALALLMCMMVTVPTFADSSAETPHDRAVISASFGLTLVSGSSYKLWAIIKNPLAVGVHATLSLYDASYNHITSVTTTSSNTTIFLSKNITLASGTYHVRISYTADGYSHAFEKTYSI